jgi:hypothetical protein
VTAIAEVFRQMYSGQLSSEEAADQISALRAASGAAVSAHEVAAGEADAVAGGATVIPGADASPAPAAIEPISFNPYRADGDPSPAEYARLTVAQMTELEAVRPGIGERMRASGEWVRGAEVNAQRERAEADRAAYEQQFRTDAEFAAGELRKRALSDLDAKWWFIPAAERALLAIDAGLTQAEFAELAGAKDRLAAGYAAAETKVGG